jgi:hypothetical protein
MIIMKEKQQLDEMARLSISSLSDKLPFRIVINAPDHQPPHAHILDRRTGKKELGQFLIPTSMPMTPSDIKDYKNGITDEMRNAILLWMGKPCKLLLEVTNWKFLVAE